MIEAIAEAVALKLEQMAATSWEKALRYRTKRDSQLRQAIVSGRK
jgi:hypothetical protein